MYNVVDDTIVAVSTAPGQSAVGIVRLGGPTALTIADRLATSDQRRPIAEHEPSSRVEGELTLDSDRSLPVVLYVFKAPHSYTRQDLVEFHTIGSPPVLSLVVKRAIELGARQAQPGEFTARAYLNGAMDLSAAQSVAGIIRAQTDTQLKAARRLGAGDLAGRIDAAMKRLAHLTALVEADIDFAQEPIEFITSDQLVSELSAVDSQLRALDAVAISAERIDVLPSVLLFGRPNTGKSSLMNVLSGTRRAICSAAAGTTRDILTAPARLGRCEALLLDVAGVKDRDEGVQALAREKALAEAQRVDMVCVVVDASVEVNGGLVEIVRSWQGASIVLVANKLDLIDDAMKEHVANRLDGWGFGPVSFVSARNGAGVEDLRARLGAVLGVDTGTVGGNAVVLTARQRSAIKDAVAGVARAIKLGQGVTEVTDCADVLAFELRETMDALGRITGQVTTEDLLDQVFASFCIGK